MLTGKAKSDFEKWYWNDWLTGSDRDYYEKDEVIENSWKVEKLFLFPLIIEWFDSVGVYVYVEPSIPIGWENPDCFIFKVGTDTNRLKLPNRQQATEEAIVKANEIYNGN